MPSPFFTACNPLPAIVDAACSVSLHFQMAVRRNVQGTLPQALRFMQDVFERAGGIVMGETHGMYSHAEFIEAFIPHAASVGADRLYVEMFTRGQQQYLDQWQDGGDRGALAWLLNHLPAHSERMRLYYQRIMHAAHENGLRVVGVEPDSKPVFYPGTNLFMRNMMWENAILADQNGKSCLRPFMLVCGAFHLDPYRCAHGRPIHDMLRIAGVRLGTGRPCLVPPLKSGNAAYMSVPRHPEQPPLMPVPRCDAGLRVGI
ncbi:MAG: ChaN family lipoprotein [Rhodospirillales bacterium]|nr:ChaN family lipoprotein [Alphaproteobacteria bacterium]MCB9987345.1 ChaN family lipoprotein [Rhodospirillales bacterium]USO07805.1 MAG: ChaN family lipoprotein [Rhodospirillales bacterium]